MCLIPPRQWLYVFSENALKKVAFFGDRTDPDSHEPEVQALTLNSAW
jgi:methylglyoxal synthase